MQKVITIKTQGRAFQLGLAESKKDLLSSLRSFDKSRAFEEANDNTSIFIALEFESEQAVGVISEETPEVALDDDLLSINYGNCKACLNIDSGALLYDIEK